MNERQSVNQRGERYGQAVREVARGSGSRVYPRGGWSCERGAGGEGDGAGGAAVRDRVELLELFG